MRCRLSIDGGVERENHFLDVILRDAGAEACEVQIFGANAVERRQVPPST